MPKHVGREASIVLAAPMLNTQRIRERLRHGAAFAEAVICREYFESTVIVREVVRGGPMLDRLTSG